MHKEERTEPVCDKCKFDLDNAEKEIIERFTDLFHVSWGRIRNNLPAFVKTETYLRVVRQKQKEWWLEKIKDDDELTRAQLDASRYFSTNGKFVPAFLAEDIMFDHIFVTLSDTKEILVYEEGIYKKGGEILIEQECQKRLTGYFTNTNRVTEVINQIKRATYVDRYQLNAHAEMYLNLENGVIDLSSGELMEHSPEYLFTSKVPIEYDPEEACPKWESFLNMVLEEGSREALQMMFGECLTFRPCSRMFLLYGASATGKSTVLKVLEMLVGRENVAHESLYALCGGDQWAIARLFGKKVNIAAELTGKIPDMEILKALTSGSDTVSGSVKYKDSIDFVNAAKLVFGMNKMPKLPATESVMRRIVMIPFVKVIPEENRIEYYAEKILRKELPGILNWAVKGLRMLEERGYPKESYDEKVEKLERVAYSIETFINECIEQSPDEKVAVEKVYQEYVTFCKTVLNSEPETKKKLSMGIKEALNVETESVKERVGGKRKSVRKYIGIRLTSEEEEDEDEIGWFNMS